MCNVHLNMSMYVNVHVSCISDPLYFVCIQLCRKALFQMNIDPFRYEYIAMILMQMKFSWIFWNYTYMDINCTRDQWMYHGWFYENISQTIIGKNLSLCVCKDCWICHPMIVPQRISVTEHTMILHSTGSKML